MKTNLELGQTVYFKADFTNDFPFELLRVTNKAVFLSSIFDDTKTEFKVKKSMITNYNQKTKVKDKICFVNHTNRGFKIDGKPLIKNSIITFVIKECENVGIISDVSGFTPQNKIYNVNFIYNERITATTITSNQITGYFTRGAKYYYKYTDIAQ